MDRIKFNPWPWRMHWMTVLILTLAAICQPVLAFEVHLTLQEPSNVARTKDLATGGLPLPPGAVKNISELSLWDGTQPVQTQLTPLIIDEEGYIRWVLVDTVVNLHAGSERVFTLKDQPVHETKAGQLIIEETPSSIKMNTGRMSLAVSKNKFRLFEYVNLDGKQLLGAVEDALSIIEAETGIRYLAGKPCRVEWDYKGPLCATLFLRGPYIDPQGNPLKGLNYSLRLTVWAEGTRILLEHEIGNSHPDKEQYIWIKRADLRLGLPGGIKGSSGLAWTEAKQEKNSVIAVLRHEGFFSVGRSRLLGLPEFTVEDNALTMHLLPRWDGDPKEKKPPRGYGKKGGYWLFDLTHKGTRISIDLGAGDTLKRATVANARLHLRAPGEWYAREEGMGLGLFGTMEDEMLTYRAWGWKGWNDTKKMQTSPKWNSFWEDTEVSFKNTHDITEADETRGMLIQYLRTGLRGFFDWAEAWARYQKTHYTYRTDDFNYSAGYTHFYEWLPGSDRAMSKEDLTARKKLGLWSCRAEALMGKYESCHAYGEGLLDWYLLTGDKSALEAVEDIGEIIEREPQGGADEPGKARPTRWDTRAFGRQLGIACRLNAATRKPRWHNLMQRMGRIALECPDLDERGFFEIWNAKGKSFWYLKSCQDLLSGNSKEPSIFTRDHAKAIISTGVRVDPDNPKSGWLIGPDGDRWQGKYFAGTWMATYVSAGIQQYFDSTGDEDARDFIIAFSRFAERYLFYRPCGYIPYYFNLDFPLKDDRLYMEGSVNWTPQHCGGRPRSGNHQGWYTWHYVDSLVRGYVLSGEKDLLELAKVLWNNGSKTGWFKGPLAADNEVYRFVSSNPWNSKDDQASSCSLLFHEYAHPRSDIEPPDVIKDLVVSGIGKGTVEVSYTVPVDPGGGRVAECQLKYDRLELADYRTWDYRRDQEKTRNWWRAKNVQGEPRPGSVGSKERFVIHGIPPGKWCFAMRTFDNSSNRSGVSNLVWADVY